MVSLQILIACSSEANQHSHIDGTLHGRKLSKRAHSSDVAHAHAKRTTLEPSTLAGHQDAPSKVGDNSTIVNNPVPDGTVSKQEWDPQAQYNMEEDVVNQQSQTGMERSIRILSFVDSITVTK